ncbi:MAG: RecX family transcriptional regulator [Bacteroidales bacterium]|nr:RecX family transcriptional regulator [Bacteroidales bacterium]
MKHFCAYQERCMQDVKQKIAPLHLQEDIYDALISRLVREDYLNEERFAKSFARGKLRINKWGKNKIYAALQQKQVPELFILEGLNDIDDKEYKHILHEVISKKSKELKDSDYNRRNKKLAKFAISKGFEPNLVWDVLNYRE